MNFNFEKSIYEDGITRQVKDLAIP